MFFGWLDWSIAFVVPSATFVHSQELCVFLEGRGSSNVRRLGDLFKEEEGERVPSVGGAFNVRATEYTRHVTFAAETAGRAAGLTCVPVVRVVLLKVTGERPTPFSVRHFRRFAADFLLSHHHRHRPRESRPEVRIRRQVSLVGDYFRDASGDE